MAKKTRLQAVRRSVLTEESAREMDVHVINANDGDTLSVIVDVENVSVPYTVAYAGRTLIYGLVDRQESVPLTRGTHRLSWAFTHLQKDWKHSISVQVNQRPLELLEERSEANKDTPYVIGLAVVQVA